MRYCGSRLLAPVLIGVAWLAFYATWYAVQPGGRHGLTIFSDTAYLVPIAVAAAIALAVPFRCNHGLRRFWTLLALALGAWLAGETLWSIRELGGHAVPFPWWTDVLYLIQYALMVPAVIAAFRPSLRAVRKTTLLDGALVVGTLALLWWWLVLKPTAVGLDLGSVVSLAYPVFDLVLLGMLVATRLLPARRGTVALAFFASGILLDAVANALYANAALAGTYFSGSWLDLGWEAEAVCFAIAGYTALRGIGARSDWARSRAPTQLGSGALLVTTFGGLLVVSLVGARHGTPPLDLVAGVAVLAALLCTRLWLALSALPDVELRDPTTGAYRPEYFRDQLQRQLVRAARYDDPFAVALVELDDAYTLAPQSLVDDTEELEVIATLTPTRFAVLLPNTNVSGAVGRAESLRALAAAAGATVSIGVAAAPDSRADVVVEDAESALEAAQRLGGNQVRIVHDCELFRRTRGVGPDQFELLLRLAASVETRAGADEGHSARVAALGRRLAIGLGLPEADVGRIYLAGLLHDIGKISLPDQLLRKGPPLEHDEWRRLKEHAEWGAVLVERIPCARDAAAGIAAHHEAWDGSGYPRGVQGEAIPVDGRVVALADAFVAMTTVQTYRSPFTTTAALTEIWRGNGRTFDPTVVSVLFELARTGELPETAEVRALSA